MLKMTEMRGENMISDKMKLIVVLLLILLLAIIVIDPAMGYLHAFKRIKNDN